MHIYLLYILLNYFPILLSNSHLYWCPSSKNLICWILSYFFIILYTKRYIWSFCLILVSILILFLWTLLSIIMHRMNCIVFFVFFRWEFLVLLYWWIALNHQIVLCFTLFFFCSYLFYFFAFKKKKKIFIIIFFFILFFFKYFFFFFKLIQNV